MSAEIIDQANELAERRELVPGCQLYTYCQQEFEERGKHQR
ncbi:hypothetical protein [Klebsiella michiganensis]|nr:hypothetical protein [Klebsiella michiganensis]